VAVLALIVACLIPLAFVMQKPKRAVPSNAPPPH